MFSDIGSPHRFYRPATERSRQRVKCRDAVPRRTCPGAAEMRHGYATIVQVIEMSNPFSSVREEDVREQERETPPGSESSFGDILNQFEQTHAHETPGDQGREATVVAVTGENVFFDIGQKIE